MINKWTSQKGYLAGKKTMSDKTENKTMKGGLNMKKRLMIVFFLVIDFIMLWVGLATLTIGRNIFGTDATLLWVSGIITCFAITGIGNIISEVIK